MKRIIGIDLGGTLIKMGLISEGKLVCLHRINAQSKIGLKPSLPQIESGIRQMLKMMDLKRSELDGIGIAFPGIVDSQSKRVLSTNQKYRDAENMDFKLWVGETFGLPFVMENDARMALLGEWKFGAGQGIDNLVMVTLGTGVGGAALIEGKLLRGKHFQAGCLGGHFIINFKGKPCTCGNIGCVESEASSWQLPNLIRAHPSFQSSAIRELKPDFENLFRLAEQGDELCLSVRNHCLEAWAAGVINLIHAYDPEVVIMGGGVMKSADLILPFVQEKVRQQAWIPWGEVQIVTAKIPNDSALMGAYALFNQNSL